MNLLKISLANIANKPLNTLLSLLLLSFGVGLISFLAILEVRLADQFDRNVKDIDLVLAAKGSPLQIMLSSVYHVDVPTGNIALSDVEALQKDRWARGSIKQLIPLSYGDNYQSYRIVGTTRDYPDHFEMTLRKGDYWQIPVLDSSWHVVNNQPTSEQQISDTLEVNVGSKVAENLELELGDTFFSAHGLDKQGEEHTNILFKVVGIYNEGHCVIDQLILTSLESIWAIHPAMEDEPAKDKEITAALIKTNRKTDMFTLNNHKLIREGNMQLAITSIETNRLNANFGIGLSALRSIGIIVTIISFISVFISLFNSLKERKYELALLRTLGGSRGKVFRLILQEGLILALAGYLIGLIISRLGLLIFSGRVSDKFHYSVGDIGMVKWEFVMLGITIFVGILASLLPAIRAVQIDISKTLSDG
jgi:putative ABC transport system permease protein